MSPFSPISVANPTQGWRTLVPFIPVWGWAGGLWRCNPCVTPKPAVAFLHPIFFLIPPLPDSPELILSVQHVHIDPQGSSVVDMRPDAIRMNPSSPSLQPFLGRLRRGTGSVALPAAGAGCAQKQVQRALRVRVV